MTFQALPWRLMTFILFVALLTCSTNAQVVLIDDSFADGDRSNTETDAHDADWWTSVSSKGIEASKGSLGLVTGPAGRGFHTIFPAQKLAAVGDELMVQYTFKTPATIGADKGSALRIGLFNSMEPEKLKANLSVSSKEPNANYKKLQGFMMDMDTGTTADLNFRKHDDKASAGRLLSTTEGFETIGDTGSDDAYKFEPDTTYTGSITVRRISDTTLLLKGAIGDETHTVSYVNESASFDMLAMHAIGGAFGSSNEVDTADNGLDFSNVKVSFTAADKPAAAKPAASGTKE